MGSLSTGIFIPGIFNENQRYIRCLWCKQSKIGLILSLDGVGWWNVPEPSDQIWIKFYHHRSSPKFQRWNLRSFPCMNYMGSFLDIMIFKPLNICLKKISWIFLPKFGYFTTHQHQSLCLIKSKLQSHQWNIRSHLFSKYQLILRHQKFWPPEIFLSPRI